MDLTRHLAGLDKLKLDNVFVVKILLSLCFIEPDGNTQMDLVKPTCTGELVVLLAPSLGPKIGYPA
jgi:hypothetical protein